MRWLSILALLATLLGARPALADDREAKTKSRALFVQGVTALDASRPADALVLFEQAYELFPHYATLYNIGLCHRALGHRAQAANAFLHFLEDSHGNAPSDETARVKTLLGALDPQLSAFTLTISPATARLTLDGKPFTAVKGPVYVEAGDHTFDASAPGMIPAHSVVTLEKGEHRTLAFELTAEAPAQAPQPAPPILPPPVHAERSRFGVPFWVTAGVSVAGLATFAIAGSAASRAHDGYVNAPDDAQAADQRSRGVTLALVADVGLVVSIVAAGVAAYLALRPHDAK